MVTDRSLQVSAPARLHFGLFSIGRLTDYQFGGAGLMIDGPRTQMTARSAGRFSVSIAASIGNQTERDELARTIDTTITCWFAAMKHSHVQLLELECWQELPVHLSLESVPPRHAGFGSGTQLAFSAAFAVTQVLGLTVPSAIEMALATGRGKRSAIGSYGFWTGGFLVDRGKSSDSGLAKLDLQVDFPVQWPIVTLVGAAGQSFSGNLERASFASLESTLPQQRAAMIARMQQRVVPAILNEDYDTFGDALYEFGRQSGEMFAAVQRGPYNGPRCAALVDRVRSLGIQAVGQSSWGPCIFAICPAEAAAEELIKAVQADSRFSGVAVGQHRADNDGVRVS